MTLTIQVNTTGGAGTAPQISLVQNTNIPIPATASVPAPTSQTITAGSAPTSSAPGGNTTAAPPPSGFQVNYLPGWNLVAGPTGTVITGSTGPLYTFQAGDTNYQTAQPGTQLRSGLGYWAYFPSRAQVGIAVSGPQTTSVSLPVNQWVMVGNPGNSPATITGADSVYTFDPAINNYTSQTTIGAGQGAWVISATGGTVTISNR